jgi:hypothetical protein
MQIPTDSIQEIEYFIFSYKYGLWLLSVGICIDILKKRKQN